MLYCHIVIYDQKLDDGYIDGVVIEDVPEYELTANGSETDPVKHQQMVAYLEKRFINIHANEARMREYFHCFFKADSQLPVTSGVGIPGTFITHPIRLSVKS